MYIGFQDSVLNNTWVYHEKNLMTTSFRLPLDRHKCSKYKETLESDQPVASQFGQDIVLYQIFKDYRNGIFLDLAAAWPKLLSNTYWLETCQGWTGFCIEGDPRKVINLVKNRTCQVIPECVTETAQWVNFGSDQIKGTNGINNKRKETGLDLFCRPLNVLLDQYGAPKRIDYMSLDVEGAEAGVIKSIGNYKVDTLTIELHQFRGNKAVSQIIKNFLNDNDYVPVTGFPLMRKGGSRNIGPFCQSQIEGAKLWGTPIDDIFSATGQLRKHTHDVFFVRSDSIHYDNIKTKFDC